MEKYELFQCVRVSVVTRTLDFFLGRVGFVDSWIGGAVRLAWRTSGLYRLKS